MKEEIMKIIKNNGDKYIDSYDDQADQIIDILSQALQKQSEEILNKLWEFREDTRNDGYGQYVLTIDKCIRLIKSNN